MSTCEDCGPGVIPSERTSFSLGGLAHLAAGLLERLREMRRVAYQRRDLRDLDDRTLRDIGVSRIDVQREAGRHFWDIDI
ncbi:MAG: DUF1127 domain-containing protein [Hyphomicrobiaceae bacterium]